MRKINGVPFTAHIDLSSLTGGEVIKWDADNGKMAWEDQDDSAYVLVKWYGDRGIFFGGNNASSRIVSVSLMKNISLAFLFTDDPLIPVAITLPNPIVCDFI